MTRKRQERVDPYAFTEVERVLWKALDFSEDPERVYRKACLTGFEGIKGLGALLQRGLIEVSTTDPGERVDPGRQLRDEIASRRRFDTVRMALWGVAVAAAAVWVYRGLLSVELFRTFTAWVDFF
ncbi:MAG: hypothetical protein E4G97_04270 [Deltaproteobacteria bacterium]|nr:MAG: hypothetical protein E4G97_04270 [Deltaproteobacteria bacterium]